MAATTLLATGVAFTQSPEEDADTYIVVLKKSVDNPSEVARGIDRRQEGFDVGFVYSEALEGFSAEIPADSLDDVRNNRQVAYVERDKVVTAFQIPSTQTLPWGVQRIGADNSLTPPESPDNILVSISNVNVYIIDTGIDLVHPDLNVVDYVSKRRTGPVEDCDGHGTHVAGTLAAIDNDSGVVGVAPGAPLTSVKVLDCTGFGTTSEVVEGVDWVTADAQTPENAGVPAVANMSLGGARSKAVNTAVRNSAASGVFYSLAAGNAGRSACKTSPAMTGRTWDGASWIHDNGILTTAATNQRNKETSWSNFGSCVDLWAPGAKIPSTWLAGGTKTLSGTSMAAPHAGGTAALYLSTDPPSTSPVDVESRLRSDSELILDHMSKNGAPIRLVDASGY